MGRDNSPDHVNQVMDGSIAQREKILQPEEAIEAMKLKMQTAFIDADAYAADPFALLGQVFQVRKKNGQIPTSLSDPGFPVELTPFPLRHKVNEKSKTLQPVLRSSFVVDQHLAASVSFLSYLSAELNRDTTFSVIVFDQATGNIDMQDADFQSGLKQWMTDHRDLIEDPDICYLFAVNAFVQKNIVRKKFKKYTGKARGGAWGVNINGELSISTDEYSLDIKFGLTPIVLKRPGQQAAPAMGMAAAPAKPLATMRLTSAEKELFQTATGLSLIRKKLVPQNHSPAASANGAASKKTAGNGTPVKKTAAKKAKPV